MKYCLPSARTQVRKPFNMATALEELNESLEAVDQSYKAMCAAEGRVLEIEEVIADRLEAFVFACKSSLQDK